MRKFYITLAISLCIACAAKAEPVISEFMAANVTTIKDGHDNYEDWIEIWNPDAAPVDLAGWRLTDELGKVSKFVFPPKVIPAGGRLVLFASNRAGSTGAATHVDVLGYLHTNFSLNKSGEYLALISPAGVASTVFSPNYGQQLDDVSFGPPGATEGLVGAGATVRYNVPTTTALDTTSPNWTAANYNDTTWASGTGPGVGFEVGTPVAHWPLDDAAASTTAVDSTGSGLNGTRSGSAVFGVAGHSAGTATGVQFSTAIGKVTVPYSAALNPAAAFSFAAWVYPVASTGTHQAIVTSRVGPANQQRGYIVYINPSNVWEFWTGYNSGGAGGWNVVSGGAATYGQWVHVAITRDAAGAKRFFLNGVQVGTTAVANNYLANNNTANGFHLGAGDDLGTAFRFNGVIDDATFWSTDIGAALVVQHRDSGGGSFPTPAYTPHYSVNVQGPMFATNLGIYTRHNFTVSDKTRYASLRLRAKYDDAYVAFLNGVEIARGNFTGTRAYDSFADSDRADTNAVVFDEVDVTAAALPAMANGANTLAIHGFRRSITHEDFLLAPQLDADLTSAAQAPGYFAVATPGTVNTGSNVNPGPEVSNVSHSPTEPAAATAITVTAHLTPRLAPIAGASLKYRVMYGAESAAIPMTDAGPSPVAVGARIFTGTIPAAHGATVRQMIRYHVTATDTAGRTWRDPFPVDLTNTDGISQSPEYHGLVIKDAALTAGMPIMQWFTNDVPNSDTRTGSRASAYYGGRFYDNIYVRQRGGFTSTGSQKFNFNRGDGLFVNTTLGTVGEVNMNAPGTDGNFFRVSTAYEIYRATGHPACHSFVIALYRNGAYQRMTHLIEQVDEDFLDRNGFDQDGAMYKFVQRIGETPLPGGDYSNSPGLGDTLYGIEKKTRIHEGLADLNAFVSGINTGTAVQRNAYLFKTMNIPNFVNFMAVRSLNAEIDVNRKNFYFYRDSDGSLEWYLFPWDKDMTFGVNYSTTESTNRANPWQSTNTFKHDPAATKQWCVLWEQGYQSPEIRAMVGRRLRTLMDTMMGTPGTAIPGNTTIEQRLEAVRAAMVPLPPGVTIANYNDRTTFNTWLANHRTALFTTYGPASVYGMIPNTGGTVNLTILSADPNPASGTQDLEHLVIVNNGVDTADMTGWTLAGGGINHTFKPGTAIVGTTTSATTNRAHVCNNRTAFRARVGAPATAEFILGNYDGALTARGGTVELRDATGTLRSSYALPVAPTASQSFLRISELMWAPLAPTLGESAAAPGAVTSDYEFIELQNTGTALLDISGARFTDGIEFTFPAATTIAPGQRIILAANAAAFAARYGAIPISGVYGGTLDNSGERIRLVDGVGEEVLDFSYDPRWLPPNYIEGRSLIVRSVAPDYATYSQLSNWSLGGSQHGTPGTSDAIYATHYSMWLWDHFTAAQIFLPDGSQNSALVGVSADAEGDLQENFAEYAYGRTPTAADNTPLATASVVNDSGSEYLAITFFRRVNALDLTYTVESTGDLVNGPWTPTTVLVAATPVGFGLEQVTFRDTVPTSATKRFIHVRAVKP